MPTDEVACPWCSWSIDLETSPLSEESAEQRRAHHMERCPKRRSQSHRRTQIDIHGQSVFEDNSNQ